MFVVYDINVYVLFVCFREEEGRRALMMEQEEQGVKDVNARGMIELTGSPGPSLSTATSGYSSCDDCGLGSEPPSPLESLECQVTVLPDQQHQQGDSIAKILPAAASGNSTSQTSLPSSSDAVTSSSAHQTSMPAAAASSTASSATAAVNQWPDFDFDISEFNDFCNGSGGGGPATDAVLSTSAAPVTQSEPLVGGEAQGATEQALADLQTVNDILSQPAPSWPNLSAGSVLGDLDPGVEMMDVDVDNEDNTDHRQMIMSLFKQQQQQDPTDDTPLIQPSIGSLSMSLDAFPPAGLLGMESITDDLAFKFTDNVMSQHMNESLFKCLGDLDSLTDMCSPAGNSGASANLTDNILNDVNMCTTAQDIQRPCSSTPPCTSALSASTPPPLIVHSDHLSVSPATSPLPQVTPAPPPTPVTPVAPATPVALPVLQKQKSVPASAFRGLDDHSYTSKTGPSPSHYSRSHSHQHHHFYYTRIG